MKTVGGRDTSSVSDGSKKIFRFEWSQFIFITDKIIITHASFQPDWAQHFQTLPLLGTPTKLNGKPFQQCPHLLPPQKGLPPRWHAIQSSQKISHIFPLPRTGLRKRSVQKPSDLLLFSSSPHFKRKCGGKRSGQWPSQSHGKIILVSSTLDQDNKPWIRDQTSN